MKRKPSWTLEEVKAKYQKLDEEEKEKTKDFHKSLDDLKAVNEAQEKAKVPHLEAIKKIEADFKDDISRLWKIRDHADSAVSDISSTKGAYIMLEELLTSEEGPSVACLIEIPYANNQDGPEYIKTLNELFGGYIPCNGYILVDTDREPHDGGWRKSGYYEVEHDLEHYERRFGDYICELPGGISEGWCYDKDPSWDDRDLEDWEDDIKESLKDEQENLDWEDDKRYRTYTLKMRVPMAWVTLVDLPGKIPFVVPK